MTSAFDVPMGGRPGDAFVDVWSRTSPHHQRQAVAMLILMYLLFAGLCCFTFWLRTGHYAPWLDDGYGPLLRKSFNPVGTDQVTLSHFLTYPISVARVPIHAITMGLLFASLSSIPILVAILYRFPYAIILAAMVVFLAAMPWLGVTVLMGCAVASLRPFRLSFRYASALLGLVPVAIYFFSASRDPAGVVPASDVDRAMRYAPWFLSLLGSCVICAIALGTAKLINYRPGGIPPLLAVLFAVPVILFHTKVGRDELEYHLLEHEIGPGSDEFFVNRDIGAIADQETTRLWSESKNQDYGAIRKAALGRAMAAALERAEQDRQEAAARCDDFLEHFSKSRYVPSVLYLKGRALDHSLRRQRLERDHRVEYQSDRPSFASRSTWQALVDNFPNSEVAVAALLKLGVLAVREGDLDGALELLERACRPSEESTAAQDVAPAPSGVQGLMAVRARPSSGLGVDPATVVVRARRLSEMLKACKADRPRPAAEVFGGANGDEPGARVHPVQLLLCLDPDDPHYAANLAGLWRTFPDSITRRYVEVRQALLIPPVSRRIERLRALDALLDGTPARAEAMFRLAEALQEDSILDEAKQTLEDLVKRFPDSAWAADARERLASVTMLGGQGDGGG